MRDLNQLNRYRLNDVERRIYGTHGGATEGVADHGRRSAPGSSTSASATPGRAGRHREGRMRLFTRIARWIINRTQRREPDFIVGGPESPYLRRWWVIPRNRWFNVYLHQFLRDDDDRALHDHPWFWCSILLVGSYIEHTIAAGGVHKRKLREAPSIKISGPWRAHRIELLPNTLRQPCWTLFITGPRIRDWGFHCPEQGWIPWQRFTAPGDKGQMGAGCDG
jgi:hypothetical protein